jgi:hypothetical protein
MHAFVRHALQEIECAFVEAGSTLTQSQVGNLGEFVTMSIGRKKAFPGYRCHPANANEPLNTISKSGVDLIWFRFAAEPSADSVLLQEVKTTRKPGMEIHYGLVDDHKKMFGRTSRQTLSIMLQAMKSRLVLDESRPDLSKRLTRIAGVSPQTCQNVTLHPTILHEDTDSDPGSIMLAVRTSIAALGWSESVIEPWSIAMSELSDRLQRLGEGL